MDAVTIVLITSPNDHITESAVSNPALLAIEDIATFDLACSRFKRRSITSILWLGQTEAENLFEGHTFGKQTLFLLIVTKLVDDHHADSIVDKEESRGRNVPLRNLIDLSSRFEEAKTGTSVALDLETIDAEGLNFFWQPHREFCAIYMLKHVTIACVHCGGSLLAHLYSTRGKVLIHAHRFPDIRDGRLELFACGLSTLARSELHVHLLKSLHFNGPN